MFNPQGKSPIELLSLSIIAIFISGLFFGGIYYVLTTVQTGLESVSCTLPAQTGYATCQEWFTATIYQLFNLKWMIIPASYIFIFVLILGMLIVGYQIGGKPIYMGLYFVAVIVLTYGGILISNVYRTLLENDIVYNIMQPFTIYNKIMLNFPWFVGISGLLSIGLSIVNYQRAKVNEPDPVSVLDY